MKPIKKYLPAVFIGCIIFLFFWSFSEAFSKDKLIHDYPVSYSAIDAYWHYAQSKYAYDTGGYHNLPDYASSAEKSITKNPPLFNQLVALVSHFTKIKIYDV